MTCSTRSNLELPEALEGTRITKETACRSARADWNFGAGPGRLPPEVLRQVLEEFDDCCGTGLPAPELPHRDPRFLELRDRMEADLRLLLDIPRAYRVLFLSGGASAQFAMVPLNLEGASADYLHTGYWSGRALAEARRLGRARAAMRATPPFRTIPASSEWDLDPQAAYLFYTDNETADGLEFPAPPETPGPPLVADMSSNILSRPVSVRRHGLIFASAQKNLGPPGLTLVIVRDDLTGHCRAGTPSLWDYGVHARYGSLYNTPPTFCWHVAARVLEWTRARGLAALAAQNRRKAERLYAPIDASALYENDVDPACRSRMNVVFRLADETLVTRFLEQARREGFVGLAGHRSRGGLRASLYNAMPMEGVEALAQFMQEFERRCG